MADVDQPQVDGGKGESPSSTEPVAAAPNAAATDEGKKQPETPVKPDAPAAPAPTKPEAKVDDLDPPIRKSNADYILERKQAKLAKAKAAELAKVDQELKDLGVNDTEDEPLDPADETLVTKVIEKKYGHVFEELSKGKEEAELTSFLNENPDFKPYEAKIKKFAAHPSRKDVPLKSIAFEVAGDDLLRIGAERERAARAKAEETRLNGDASGGRGESKKSVNDMSPAEFEEHIAKIKRGEKV